MAFVLSNFIGRVYESAPKFPKMTTYKVEGKNYFLVNTDSAEKVSLKDFLTFSENDPKDTGYEKADEKFTELMKEITESDYRTNDIFSLDIYKERAEVQEIPLYIEPSSLGTGTVSEIKNEEMIVSLEIPRLLLGLSQFSPTKIQCYYSLMIEKTLFFNQTLYKMGVHFYDCKLRFVGTVTSPGKKTKQISLLDPSLEKDEPTANLHRTERAWLEEYTSHFKMHNFKIEKDDEDFGPFLREISRYKEVYEQGVLRSLEDFCDVLKSQYADYITIKN
jgi:hypothetical protein